MFALFRSRFGVPGAISVIALIFAMTGGAFAAKYAVTSTNQIKPSVLKALKGKPGPVGPQGSAGPLGPTGAAGKDGASVTASSFIGVKGTCPNGGVEVKSTDGTAFVCNGKAGGGGQAGLPATLPSGKTETGAWALGTDDGPSVVPITFNIPLAEAPTALHYVNKANEEKTGFEEFHARQNCLGSFEAPTAPAGHVCIYTESENIEEGFPGFVPSPPFTKLYTSGATFFFSLPAGSWAFGTWAVTAG